MEQHPLPRQITSFEFKLVGFMTLHQFIYLLVFVPMGFAVYRITPIPFVNVLLGFIIASIGMLLAFLPVNDRPLDVFLKNLYKRLTSPTQYLYQKSNQPTSFLDNVHTASDQHRAAHADSQDKLNKYLNSKSTQTTAAVKKVLDTPTPEKFSTKLSPKVFEKMGDTAKGPISGERQPFFMGVIKNNKNKPLPEILVYLKDESDTPIRLLKTNPHGVFATYSSLPQGEYLMEAKDPRGSYLFDTMKVSLSASNPAPFTMLSKGVL